MVPRDGPKLRWSAMTDLSDPEAAARRDQLKSVYLEARECESCPLHETRTNVVFGSGNADAALMFVGEAPGANEDKQGLPFVGQAGKLLDKLLGEIGMTRADVFVANVLKCRPPGNRDPLPGEIETCQQYLWKQVALIEPTVICTLGNFATKLLRDDPTGISRIHGQPEVVVVGERAVRLYPLYHPAAALYTPRMLETLRADFARLPEILALGPPQQPEPASLDVAAASALEESSDAPLTEDGSVSASQLSPDAQPDSDVRPGPDARPGPDVRPGADVQPGPDAQLGLF